MTNATLGGIGQGVMQGLGFIRQLNADKRADQALQNQTELLDMKRQDQAYQVAERDRKDRLMKGFQGIMAEPGLEDAERYSRFAREYAKDMTPDEHVAVKKVVDPMVDVFGKDAIDQAVYGKDLSGIEKVIGMRLPGAKASYSPDGKSLVVTTPDSKSTEFGGWGDFAKTYGISSFLKEQQDKSKTALDQRKTLADVGLKEAQTATEVQKAGYYGRLPQDRFSAGGIGGARAGAGGKEPKPYDPISSLEDFNKAMGNDPATNQPYSWAPTALQHYQQLQEANPDLANSKSGGQYLLNMARALGVGQAKAVPEIDANGNVKLVASWAGEGGKSPRKVVLQDNIEVGDLSMVQGVGGKQILKPEDWSEFRGYAIQSYAKQRPQEYALVAPIAADDAKLAKLAAAAESDPNAMRQYRFARLIREQLQHQSLAPATAPSKSGMSAEDAKFASAIGIDPEDPGLSGRLGALANRFTNAISGVLKRGQQATFDSQLKALKRNPNDRSVREWLLAKSMGNPELQARVLAAAPQKAE